MATANIQSTSQPGGMPHTRDSRGEAAKAAAEYIKTRTAVQPKIGLILGSGLGALGDEISGADRIEYAEIPGFPVSTVEGHAGRLVFGMLGGETVGGTSNAEGLRGAVAAEACGGTLGTAAATDAINAAEASGGTPDTAAATDAINASNTGGVAKPVMIMQGRFHYYEGYSMDEVVFPVRVMKMLGVETVVVTNAAGGITGDLSPGDLMLITDHIKLFTDSPLRGPNIGEFGPRFNDMSAAYTPELREVAREAARRTEMTLREGVYAHMPGPSFETPAEIRMLRTLGADAVGMSTVPEVITAVHAGMRVLGISAIANYAAGILDQPLNHEEVMEMGRRMQAGFARLVKTIVEMMR